MKRDTLLSLLLLVNYYLLSIRIQGNGPGIAIPDI